MLKIAIKLISVCYQNCDSLASPLRMPISFTVMFATRVLLERSCCYESVCVCVNECDRVR